MHLILLGVMSTFWRSVKLACVFQTRSFKSMAPKALPLPTTASKVARKEIMAENFLEFSMFVFLGFFVYFSVVFTLIRCHLTPLT